MRRIHTLLLASLSFVVLATVAPGRVHAAGSATPAQSGWDTALSAELERRGAIALDPYRCLERARNPARQPCVIARSTRDEAERGIARFSVQTLDGAPGSGVDTLARDGAGAWLLFIAAQPAPDLPEATYHLLQLPEALRPCAPDAEPLALRAAPDEDAPPLASVPPGTDLLAEEFVLTAPRLGATPGAGYYRLSAPLDGWVSAYRVYDARQPDCFLRTLLEDGA